MMTHQMTHNCLRLLEATHASQVCVPSRLSESFGYLNKKGFCSGTTCHVFAVVLGEFNVIFDQSVSACCQHAHQESKIMLFKQLQQTHALAFGSALCNTMSCWYRLSRSRLLHKDVYCFKVDALMQLVPVIHQFEMHSAMKHASYGGQTLCDPDQCILVHTLIGSCSA